MKTARVFAMLVFAAVAVPVGAQIPYLMNYEGWYEVDGVPYNGDIGLRLRLCDSASGGTCLYEDTGTVSVVDGVYVTLIGDLTTQGSLTNALASGQSFLEVVVNDVVDGPRQQLLPVAYALKADGVRDGGVTAVMIAPGAIGPAHLAPNAVSSAAISDGSVTTGDLDLDDLDQRYVGLVTGRVLYADSFASNPFLWGWSNNAYASWIPGAIRFRVAAPNNQHGIAAYTNGNYGPSAYRLSLRLLNTTTHGLNIRVCRDTVQAAALSNIRTAGVYVLSWTGSWNRIVCEGVPYGNPQYLDMTDFLVSELERVHEQALFVDKLFAGGLTMDSLQAAQLAGVTNIVGPFSPNVATPGFAFRPRSRPTRTAPAPSPSRPPTATTALRPATCC